jgi:hypothetical protein
MPDFNNRNWIRKSFKVSFDERPAIATDFTTTTYGSKGGKTYAAFFAGSVDNGGCGSQEGLFNTGLPRWESFVNWFIMRRPVMTVTVTQTAETNSVRAYNMDDYLEPDFITPPTARIPGGFQANDYPEGNGKWFYEDFSVDDLKTQFSECSLTIRNLGEWELVKIGSGTPPSPG